MPDPAVRVVAFLVAHDHHRTPVEGADPRQHGGILAVETISGKRDEILNERRNEDRRVGARRVPGDLGLLPRAEFAIGLDEETVELRLQTIDLLDNIDAIVDRQPAKLLDLALEFDDRPLEFQCQTHDGGDSVPIRPT